MLERTIKSPEAGALDTSKKVPHVSLIESSRTVRSEYGIGVGTQLAQWLSLKFSPTQISGQEYYYYRLYECRAREEAFRFLGFRSQLVLNRLCTHPDWRAIVNDKFLFSCLFEKLGFSVPKNVAVYHPTREFGSLKTLRNRVALRKFLQDCKRYPLFSKPVDGIWSTGIARLSGFDAASDELELADGRRISADSYMAQLEGFKNGYLFQEILHPHDAIRNLCGDRVASVRLIVIGEPAGYRIVRALWKIPAGKNMADNYWRDGNMLAALDIDSGRVTRVVRGVGEFHEKVEAHPNTGKSLVGFEIPHWNASKALCLAAAAVLPHIKIQAWDIAVCPEGPVLQEINAGGDYNLPQLAHRSGLLDDEFQKFLNCVAPTWRWELKKSLVRSLLPQKPRSVLRRIARTLLRGN
ncbi:MAG: hypothetical protein GEU87_14710 [Alphaproteobacteria bacterium]|nr:hypothetical protein [Alphaproteobacteria bacterium]